MLKFSKNLIIGQKSTNLHNCLLVGFSGELTMKPAEMMRGIMQRVWKAMSKSLSSKLSLTCGIFLYNSTWQNTAKPFFFLFTKF